MKKSVKAALFGLAGGIVAFLASGWASLSILMQRDGCANIPTDADYAQAGALCVWTVFVRAVIGGGVIGLLTLALVAGYTFRRPSRSVLDKSEQAN
jgi:hypothetical protein